MTYAPGRRVRDIHDFQEYTVVSDFDMGRAYELISDDGILEYIYANDLEPVDEE